MKFECGKKRRLKEAARRQWHRWFAWYPVKIAFEDCRWLEIVERRYMKSRYDYYEDEAAYEYRLPCSEDAS